MVYEPLYHAREIVTIKLSSGCTCKAKSARSSNSSFYNKIIIPLTLVGYEMIIANSAPGLSPPQRFDGVLCVSAERSAEFYACTHFSQRSLYGGERH